ncbi:MAG: transporter permease [Ramlibacter sp.]|nr:transporter permease [Ramlibacter sp.]
MVLSIQRLLAASLIAACAGALAQPAGISDRAIRIGVINDRSGPYMDATGEGSVVAARLAAEEFKNSINGAPIEILFGDHLNKPDVGSAMARKWFDNDKVDVIVDIGPSNVGFAIVSLGNERGKMVLTNSASSDFTGKACTKYSAQWNYNTFSNSKAMAAAAVKEGLDTWFLIVADYSFGHSMSADLRRELAPRGAKILGEVKVPLNTPDFTSYLLQAQASGAKAIGLAIAGQDVVTTVKQAAELNIQKKQTLVGLTVNVSEIEALGLETAQGLLVVSTFEWNRNKVTRDWTKRFTDKFTKLPTANQAAVYSQVKHYLRAVQATGTDEPGAVMAKMRELPVQDAFAENGRLREDGQMLHDIYVARTKKPSESTAKGDYFQVIQVVPGEQAFASLADTACPLVKK